MGIYLNTNAAFVLYQELVNSRYFVDKSSIIDKISQRIKTSLKYICVTKPRRFGKTSVLNMLGAYYVACVITLAYLSARNKYWIEREEKSGKGSRG